MPSDSRVSYERTHRDQAAGERKRLFTIDVDGRPGKVGGRVTYQGVLTDVQSAELLKAATAIAAGRSIEVRVLPKKVPITRKGKSNGRPPRKA